MNVYALGSGTDHPALTKATPPFTVDFVLLTTPEEELFKDDVDLLALYRSYGRPIVSELTGVKNLSRSNYQPIDCGFYDQFEAAIVQRRAVELEYRLPNGLPIIQTTRLRDLKTSQAEEYVQLAEGNWLRLDRVVSVDGITGGDSCAS